MFNLNSTELEEKGAKNTITEILQQPKMWKETLEISLSIYDKFQNLLKKHLRKEDAQIIFTGAGSSEYVGNSIVPHLKEKYGNKIQSIATTDLVSSPWSFIKKNQPTLLISFGRSGNSPESIGAINNLNIFCEDIVHVVITCNKDGEMNKLITKDENGLVINLPERTHDKAFAMTSSFTSMMLIAYALLGLSKEEIYKLLNDFDEIVAPVNKFLNEDYILAEKINGNFNFKKIVYLGSHALKYLGEECQLKMLELTQGEVSTAFNSILGFRHGPKSMVNDKTLIIIMLSENEYTRRYEIDLVEELIGQRDKYEIVVLDNREDSKVREAVTYYYVFNSYKNYELLLNFYYIVFAQVLATIKSIDTGVKPDDPSPTGFVNRVVEGVTLYKLEDNL